LLLALEKLYIIVGAGSGAKPANLNNQEEEREMERGLSPMMSFKGTTTVTVLLKSHNISQ
jgi:hypothetical protein